MPGSVRARKKSVDLRLQRGGLAGVRAARVRRGSHRALAERVFQGLAALPEPVAVEESGGVEALDDLGDLLDRRSLRAATPEDLPDLLDRVVAVEERDQVQERRGEHRDLIGEAGGIPEGHAALPFVLDGKRLEGSEPRPGGAGHSASK
ncbi:MAG: hypothetical protein ACREJS_05110 [Candidatus Rokuibacteriota bacterium]